MRGLMKVFPLGSADTVPRAVHVNILTTYP